MSDSISVKTALISVSDKTGVVELAQGLVAKGVRLISTGGTARALRNAGLEVTPVADITQFEEMMNGRVKTLHPKIHGGILGQRDAHADDAQKHDIEWIDLVVCNLYPFAKTIAGDHDLNQAIENIDIGGPSMIRAAAKNCHWVTVLTDNSDYVEFLSQLDKGLSFNFRRQLSAKAFAHTAHYDSIIAAYLTQEDFPQQLSLGCEKKQTLRYGENPHQTAAWYVNANNPFNQQIQGKELSFNNIADSSAALQCVSEFAQPCAVVVKHANPCGVSVADDIDTAFKQAWEGDSRSAFGGIVALNRPCTDEIAEFLSSVFIEIVLAPEYSEGALEHFAKKPNCRVLQLDQSAYQREAWHYKPVQGGLLVQQADLQSLNLASLNCVTKAQPDAQQKHDMVFAWQVIKHIKSNGILTVRNGQTLGVGAGQVSRIDAVELSIKKSGDDLSGAVLASDAFFPFRDSIDYIAQNTPIKLIVQPGGSMRDQEVIDACNEHGIAMVMTGSRCFYH